MKNPENVKKGQELAKKNKERLENMSIQEKHEYFAKIALKRKSNKAKDKILSKSLIKLVNGTYVDETDGEKLTVADKMNIAIAAKAMSGDVEAYKVVRDTIGEKPTDKFDTDNKIEIVLSGDLKNLAK